MKETTYRDFLDAVSTINGYLQRAPIEDLLGLRALVLEATARAVTNRFEEASHD